ncbi:MAG TPA: c-type cytochrome [Terracidiphilus sp.]|jgi:glucose dehydrogenase|nr:c-type cytochrome [Terracidiphilus sp.]
MACAALCALAIRPVARCQSANWTIAGGSPGNTHYSTLTQIDRSNVARLGVAWKFDTGQQGGLETTPIVVDGVLYAYTPQQQVIALDAATGALKWKFDSGMKGTQPDRGLTWWTDGKQSRLFAGVMSFVYALDPATGKPIPSFGQGGRIDLRENLGRDPALQSVALTSPGVIYKNLLIVGGRNPETLPAPPGDIRAYDVRTGVLRWSFHTIPHPGEFGYNTWPKDAWKNSGAANNWAGMAVDRERGIVYVPTGSAVPDFYGATRVGDDLFANTLLALDAATGKRLWHFQGVHHDEWDRDFPSAPLLVTIKHNGRPVPALAQTTKQGYLYLFNRVTGAPLYPIVEKPYPASTTPGEVSAGTQPFPTWPPPFTRQQITPDTLTNRTPQAHAWAVERLRSLRHDGQFTPLTEGQDTLVFPSFEGGGEWGGPAVDPQTQILYINANTYGSLGALAASHGGSPGRRIYLSQCSVCHGDHRQGSGEFPALIHIGDKLTPAQIAATIGNGKGRMPPMPMKPAALSNLLNFLLREKENAPAGEAQAAATAGNESAAATTTIATDAERRAGGEVYADNCAICHGDKMEGIAPSFPALLGVADREPADRILAVIHDGRGRMPGFPNLAAAQIGSLMHFLRTPAAPLAADAAVGGAVEYNLTGYRRFNDPDGYPATATPWGTLNALDLKTGKYLWKIPLGQYPELAAMGRQDTGSENYGGPVVTAGGLIFIAATNFDHKIRAFDKTTGKLLWQATLPFAGNATPAVYEVQGREFVVIAAGGSTMNPRGPIGGVYVAFALPQ